MARRCSALQHVMGMQLKQTRKISKNLWKKQYVCPVCRKTKTRISRNKY